MVQMRFNRGWPHRGFALLWDAKVLADLTAPKTVLSLRQFYAQVDSWPEDLPAANGKCHGRFRFRGLSGYPRRP